MGLAIILILLAPLVLAGGLFATVFFGSNERFEWVAAVTFFGSFLYVIVAIALLILQIFGAIDLPSPHITWS